VEEDDYRYLIAVVQAQLRSIGAADIADDRHYLVANPDDGEARLLEPLDHLLSMLKAFERKLAIEDRRTYQKALSRINERVRGNPIRGAEYIPVRDGERELLAIDLQRAPELSELRQSLQGLIGSLLESRLPPRRLT